MSLVEDALPTLTDAQIGRLAKVDHRITTKVTRRIVGQRHRETIAVDTAPSATTFAAGLPTERP